MNKQTLLSSLLLLLAAAIWGFSFVAQRVGARSMPAFSFNGIRFTLGVLSLLPVMWLQRRKGAPLQKGVLRSSIWGGIIGGVLLFIASALQQIGIADTQSGEAAFITGLYLALVPILGLALRQKVRPVTWLGVCFALCGLYLLCLGDAMRLRKADVYLLLGALFWAIHIQLINHVAPRSHTLSLSVIQYAVCAAFSLGTAALFETIEFSVVMDTVLPLIYGGVGSVGIAYTLQAVGQKHVAPAHAGILLSLEAVFATLGGIWLLGEQMTSRSLLGCAMMLLGMVLPQLAALAKKPLDAAEPLANDLG